MAITATADSIHITDIIVNRGKGNCKVESSIDKKLEYGEIWDDIPISGCDRVLEVEVKTDNGTWLFNFL